MLFAVSAGFGQTLTGDQLRADATSVKVFQGAGPNPASIQSAVDQFRAALGGINNANAPGPLAGGRRDQLGRRRLDGYFAGRDAVRCVFEQPRQSLDDAGNRFRTGAAVGFGRLFCEPELRDHLSGVQPGQVIFAGRQQHYRHELFHSGYRRCHGGNDAGFGVVFTDVDLPDGSGPGDKRGNRKASTLVEYFAADGSLIYSGFAAASPGDGGLSFLGIVLDDDGGLRAFTL